MSLNKQNLNVLLGSEIRKKQEPTDPFVRKGEVAVQEIFVKRNTIVGQKDGQILGGIKTLGQSTNSSEEVITSAIGQITDDLPALSGAKGNLLEVSFDTVLDSDGKFLRFKLPTDSDGGIALAPIIADSNGELFRGVGRDSDNPARSFGTLSTTVTSLTGLPALRANKPTSALAVISDGTAQSIAECVSVAEDKKSKDFAEIAAFTDVIEAMKPPASVSGGLFGKIKKAMSAVSFAGGLTGTLSQIAPLASLNEQVASIGDKIDAIALPGNIGTIGELNELAQNVMATPGELLQGAGDLVSNFTGQFAQDALAQFQSLKDTLPDLPSVEDVVGTDLTDVKSALDEFKEAADNFDTNFDNRTEMGLGGVLQNLSERLSGAAASFIQNIVPGGIITSDEERRKILEQFGSGDENQKKEAVKTLTKKSNNVTSRMKDILDKDTRSTNTLDMQIEMIETARKQDVPEQEIAIAQQEISRIKESMEELNTTISGTVVIDADLFDEGVPIDNSSRWSGKNSPDDVFTMVSSVEELDAEMQKVYRPITEVVVHATETFTNKDIGSIEINNMQIELGHEGIGYHYVIRRDGRLQRGRPVNTVGEHAPINGHDAFSIGLALVGGLNVSSGDNNPTDYRSSQSFTREQFTTLEKFIKSFYRRFPGGQVFGHNDIDETEFDPYFDVPDYVESVFRKINKTTEPLITGPLSEAEINNDN
jgi:N-acetylmuramoyl-L-alanine amidase